MLEFKTTPSSFKESQMIIYDVVLDRIRNESALFLYEELKSFFKSFGIKLTRINKKNKLPYICMGYYSKCKSELQKIPLNSS